MIPALLDKQTLQFINRKTLRYTPVTAEKDYFLTLALKILSESVLYTTLVFKGGTALHHCYLPQSRFSEDLDFTSLDKTITGEAVTAIFAPYSFFNETIHLIQQKELRQPIIKSSILNNWRVASEQRRDEVDLIYYKDDIFDNGEKIETLLQNLPFDTLDSLIKE